jgi:hypothetical protein
MVAGGIEQAGQENQRSGHKIHPTPPEGDQASMKAGQFVAAELQRLRSCKGDAPSSSKFMNESQIRCRSFTLFGWPIAPASTQKNSEHRKTLNTEKL